MRWWLHAGGALALLLLALAERDQRTHLSPQFAVNSRYGRSEQHSPHLFVLGSRYGKRTPGGALRGSVRGAHWSPRVSPLRGGGGAKSYTRGSEDARNSRSVAQWALRSRSLAAAKPGYNFKHAPSRSWREGWLQ